MKYQSIYVSPADNVSTKFEMRLWSDDDNRITPPEKGVCPMCKKEQLLVPVWKKDGEKESMVWKCTSCGHTIQ